MYYHFNFLEKIYIHEFKLILNVKNLNSIIDYMMTIIKFIMKINLYLKDLSVLMIKEKNL